MTSNDNKISSRSCDILIIGGGSAGLRVAIEAHDAGHRFLLLARAEEEIRTQYLHVVASMQPWELWIHKIIG